MKVSFDDSRNTFQYDENASEIRLKLKSSEGKGAPGKLFLGDYLASSFVQLKHRTCKYTVNCGGKDLYGYSREEGVTYLNIDPDDSVNGSMAVFDDAFAFIDKALVGSSNIVVFCQNGLSKSASIVLYYIMKKKRISLSEAVKLVEDSRCLKMRPDLVKVLMGIEKKMYGGVPSIELGGLHNREILHTADIFKTSSGKKASDKGGSGGGALLPCAIFVGFVAALFAGLYLITGKI